MKITTLAFALTAALITGCTGTGSSSSSSSSNSSSTSSSSNSSSSSSSSNSSSSTSSSSSSSSSGVSIGVDINVDLPAEMRITTDGERLEQGGFYNAKFYQEDTLETVYLDFPQADFETQLTNNYTSKTPITATLRYKDKTLEQVGVRYRGMTSYQRANRKKSFDIDLEWKIDGQDLNGYNSIKLNNGYEDESAMREVLYNNLTRKNIPSAKANFVRVMVNGEDFGVYANVQKLNKDHAKEWFLDKEATRWRAEKTGGGSIGGAGGIFGAGRSSLNNLGEQGTAYTNDYTLKHSAVADPWQDLANAAHTMGVVTQEYLIEELSQYMDIDAALWFIASENVFMDDDGYINKGGMDYYVYYDVASGRIVPIEYDGNSAFHAAFNATWVPLYKLNDANFPLISKLLNIPVLRQRYLAHYRTVLEESLNPTIALAKVEQYKSLISPALSSSTIVRQYTYAQYQTAVESLKSTISTRYETLQNHADVKAPVINISSVVDSVGGQPATRPTDQQAVDITANVTIAEGVKAVNLFYGVGLAGNFNQIPMRVAASGAYQAQIPAQAKASFVRYYIEAVANNSTSSVGYNPKGAEHDVYIYQVLAGAQVASAIVLNELMPSNSKTATDESGDYGDWIELYNNSDKPVSIAGWYLTDEDTNLKRWSFPATTEVPARGTLVVWADEKTLTTGLHANFKLSASGESVLLVKSDGTIVDQVTFPAAEKDQSYARQPNGTGGWGWAQSPSFKALNP